MEEIELLNKLKLLIESIYPRYDLLYKPISPVFETKLSQQFTVSSSVKIQSNTLIKYNLESDASVFMPIHLKNNGGCDNVKDDDIGRCGGGRGIIST
ncbi:1385_t:CDS:2 [Entrophospora sp. SA101]|nr:1385_t:CDS:2 [Entrophospora sp. SA101]